MGFKGLKSLVFGKQTNKYLVPYFLFSVLTLMHSRKLGVRKMLTLHAKLSERQIYERKQTETKDHWKQFGPVSSDLC